MFLGFRFRVSGFKTTWVGSYPAGHQKPFAYTSKIYTSMPDLRETALEHKSLHSAKPIVLIFWGVFRAVRFLL